MIDVKKIAKLANLPLNQEEEKKFSEQLGQVVDLVSKLQAINTTNITPTSQVTGQTNVFREDKIENDRVLTQAEALSNAKKTQNGFFAVSKVFE